MRIFRLLRVNSAVWIVLAAGFLLIPLKWFLAMLIGACLHELCHIAAIKMCGGRVYEISVGPWGAVIETEPLSRGAEALCALAGPVIPLCVIAFSKWMPELAVCILVQSGFNLLPIMPLDGGRTLHCLIPGRIFRFLECFVLTAIGIAGIVGCFFLELGILPLVAAGFVIGKAVNRKFPCKEAKHRVQ